MADIDTEAMLAQHQWDGTKRGEPVCLCGMTFGAKTRHAMAAHQAAALAPLLAERERAAAERAWDDAVLTAIDCGWLTDGYDAQDVKDRNPHRREDEDR